jgi:hypothetical protein
MSLGPASIVDAPAPQPPQFTLVGSAQVADETDERWMNGVRVRTFPCGPALAYSVCGGSGGINKAPGDGPGLLDTVEPVQIYLPVSCQVRHGDLYSDLRAMAVTAFGTYEYAAIEREFELGEIEPANPRLAAGAAVTQLNGGAAAKLRLGVGLLELCIAKTGSLGMIHARADIASDLVQSGGARQVGSRLVTPLGTIVVPGYGYTGAAPNGTAPAANQAWVYATGLVQLRRQTTPIVIPDSVADAVDHQTNTMEITVERAYQVAWDGCLHSAVLIDRTL